MTATWLILSLLYEWLAAGGRNTRYYTNNGRIITYIDIFKREKLFKLNAIFT